MRIVQAGRGYYSGAQCTSLTRVQSSALAEIWDHTADVAMSSKKKQRGKKKDAHEC